jgi:hypothetical protein
MYLLNRPGIPQRAVGEPYDGGTQNRDKPLKKCCYIIHHALPSHNYLSLTILLHNQTDYPLDKTCIGTPFATREVPKP